MKQEDAQVPAADGAPVERGVRPLREGEVMGVYLDFDRRADRAQQPVDYLLGFGAAVSAATVAANAEAEAEIERLRTLLWHWRWTGYSKQRDAETDAALGNWRPNVGAKAPT